VEKAMTIIEQLIMLRSALAGLVGVDGLDELKEMEIFIRSAPAPAQDKAVSVDAIHALMATLEHKQ
jgi:hypothetical protein